MKIRLLAFATLLILSFTVHAQLQKDKFDNAFAVLMQGSGNVTESEYNNFWDTFKLEDKDKKEVVKALKAIYLDSIEYQKILWQCAEVAWKTQKPQSCKSAFQLYAVMRENIRKSGGDVSLMTNSEENSKRLLAAAALRSEVISTIDNRRVSLSLELIQNGYMSKVSVIKRLNQVLTIKYEKPTS
jgi:hypothetical protein